jgi:cytochrome c oxidase subunit 4
MSDHATQPHARGGDLGDEHEEAGIRTYTIIYLALVALLIATVLAGAIDLGWFNLFIAMTIAVVKAVMVVLWFMHVKYSGKLVWVFSAAAFLWLGILLVLTFSDYVSRGWVPRRLEATPVTDILPTSPRTPEQPLVPPYETEHSRESDVGPTGETRATPPASTTRPAPPQPRGLD